MKIAVKADFKTKNFCISRSYTRFIEKEINLVNCKFFQKIFVLFIAFSTILLFPDSPRQLGNICKSYNSKIICNVW